MTEEMRAVLKHWHNLLECKAPLDFAREGFGSPACQLCNNRRAPWIQCAKEGDPCPIYKATGKVDCCDTPYNEAAEAIEYYIYSPTKENLDIAHKYVEAEVDFLECIARIQEYPNRTVALRRWVRTHAAFVGTDSTTQEKASD